MASIEEKKTFLLQYRKHARIEQGIIDEIRTLRANAMIHSHTIDGMPHGTNTSDYSSYMASVEKYYKKLNAELERKQEIRQVIINALETLPNENYKLIMRFRYINLWDWKRISETMTYAAAHVMREHKKALELLEIPENEIICNERNKAV